MGSIAYYSYGRCLVCFFLIIDIINYQKFGCCCWESFLLHHSTYQASYHTIKGFENNSEDFNAFKKSIFANRITYFGYYKIEPNFMILISPIIHIL